MLSTNGKQSMLSKGEDKANKLISWPKLNSISITL